MSHHSNPPTVAATERFPASPRSVAVSAASAPGVSPGEEPGSETLPALAGEDARATCRTALAVTSLLAGVTFQVTAADAAFADELTAKLKNADTCQQSWDTAVAAGAKAVKPLVALLPDADFEVARAAKRGLQRIARNVSRPGAEKERVAVIAELLPFAEKGVPLNAHRDIVMLLGEIGGDETVPALATLLQKEDLREHARLALERIPGKAALRALEQALHTVPENFRFSIASSLRARGEKVKEYPSQRRVPTKATTVKINKTG